MTSNNPAPAASAPAGGPEGEDGRGFGADSPTAAQGPEAAPRPPRYTLRPVVKPLASGNARAASPSAAAGARAENEDDDGYDPYSDYHDGTAAAPTFEPDPWR